MPFPASVTDEAESLHLYAVFHLNLLFSSLEEEDRGTVIERCYWPLLALAERTGLPLGIEASGMTLEIIDRLAPGWIATLRRLMDRGLVEFIGSGQAQLIGPLAPADIVEANLLTGLETYEGLLGTRPTLALVNEQAYSAGLVGHYRRAGFDAILMDWDGTATHHPEWDPETRYLPQRALGADGETLPVLWTSTIAFQKLQRLAHDDMDEADYLAYVRRHAGPGVRAFPVYGNDAEVFDFRPGRYGTEAQLDGAISEWARVERAFQALADDPVCRFVRPSDALTLNGKPGGDRPLRLESPACPIPVKKQHKYNVARWAVTGRDDLTANTLCWQRFEALKADKSEAARRTGPAWKTLCELWASDYRTHITPKRWARYHDALGAPAAVDACPQSALSETLPPDIEIARKGRRLRIVTPSVSAQFDTKKGLSLDRLGFGEAPTLLGTLPHGYYDDIAYGVDWFSGTTILETPARPKVTDLAATEPHIGFDAEEDALCVSAELPTPLGPISKEIRIFRAVPKLKYRLTLRWEEWPRGSLRLGNFTLLPEAFDAASLFMRTHNGGREAERFDLAGHTVDLGAPVSFLVSARSGLGMTEGWLDIGDDLHRVRIEVNMAQAALLGLMTHARVDDRFFCRLSLSAMEMDDTRKPLEDSYAPRQFEFSVSG